MSLFYVHGQQFSQHLTLAICSKLKQLYYHAAFILQYKKVSLATLTSD